MAALSILKKKRLQQARHVVSFYRTLVHRNVLAFSAHQCRRKAPTSKVLQSRSAFGMFRNQVTTLLNEGSDADMRKFTGLSFGELHVLYNAIKDKLAPKKHSTRRALSAKEKLLMTLSFLRGGWSMNYSTTQWLISRWAMSRMLKKVCEQICQYVKSDKDFTPETAPEWKRVARGFEERWQLPHCVGCVDGMHVRIRKFAKSGSLHWNYKKFNSIILLAVVDSNYRILHFNVGAPGIRSDGGVFNEDRLGATIKDCSIDLPSPAALPKDPEGKEVQYFFCGDAAFGAGPHMVTPYSGESLTEDQVYCNYRISRARMCVECVFGHLKSRFGVLNYLTPRRDLATLIVRTCCYLHNFLRGCRKDDMDELKAISRRGRQLFTDRITDDSPDLLSGAELREGLRQYFWTKDNIGRVRPSCS